MGTGAVAGSLLLPGPSAVHAAGPAGSDPKPIPWLLADPDAPIHILLPGIPGFQPPEDEPSTISDFHGMVAMAIVDGTGIGKAGDGSETAYNFEVDLRFMEGVYQDYAGKTRPGAFALI